MESLYEYGSRRGFWRLHKLFQEKKIPITIFGVGMALEKNLEICEAIKNSDYEVASHGWRWIDYQNIKKSEEKRHMKLAIQVHKKIFGERPHGWYTGRCSPNTRDLVFEDGGFLYDSDSYSDDLPYWEYRNKKKQLNNNKTEKTEKKNKDKKKKRKKKEKEKRQIGKRKKKTLGGTPVNP